MQKDYIVRHKKGIIIGLDILIGLMILGGITALLYPPVSDLLNKRHQSAAISSYETTSGMMREEERSQLLEAANAYNKQLPGLLRSNHETGIAESTAYLETLNISGSGIMGVIDIEKIGVHLPIYHGTSDSVLQIAAGHMPETSLPVGGAGTHAAISAHTGLKSAKLFTDLDRLAVGDFFTVTVLNEKLYYQVDQIKVVEPDDKTDLAVFPGRDLVTLVTCTPYGINSHRLLVRGSRISHEEERVIADRLLGNEALTADMHIAAICFWIPPVLFGIYMLVSGRKQKKDTEGANT